MTTNMDEIADIVRAIGQQQGQNSYYRVCYSFFKQLQDLIFHTSNDLLQIYHANDSASVQGLRPASDIAIILQNAVEDLNTQAQRAQSNWENFYQPNC